MSRNFVLPPINSRRSRRGSVSAPPPLDRPSSCQSGNVTKPVHVPDLSKSYDPSVPRSMRKGHARSVSNYSGHPAGSRSRPGSRMVSSGPAQDYPRQLGSPYPAVQPEFIKRSSSEECLKCMLKVEHKKCQAHKYIRVGGGYRHSYLYVKAMMEQLELQKQKEELLRQRLEAIHEKTVHAIKTFIRTKSGRLVERIVFLTEEDYLAFKAGVNPEDILKKYLSKDEAAGLENWDSEEQKAIKTYIRTKSGRLIEKIMYISKEEYEAIKAGKLDAKDVLKKYMDDGETVEGWGEAEMKAVKTFIRTKSGRLIEKIIMVSKEDYEKLQKDPAAMAEILGKYMAVDEGAVIEGWTKQEPTAMKVVKAMIRTKSGRLIEKTILMTEEEYKKFMEAGGDVSQLKKYLDLHPDDVIEGWEKASTVYSGGSDDEEIQKAKVGTQIMGKDGQLYEIVVDPITGKKYKKRIVTEADPNEKGMTIEQIKAYRTGKRRDGSDSEFSYRSFISEGGTRHVKRRRKRGDGTYSAEESYHSEDDEAGKARRLKRRQARKAAAIKEKEKKNKPIKGPLGLGGVTDNDPHEKGMTAEQIKAYRAGKRRDGSDSEFSYRSFVSEGGTRHVKRRRKRGDGTYSAEESYNSEDDEAGKARRQKRRQTRKAAAIKEKKKNYAKGKRNPDGSDSEFSYRSYVSDGGTRHVKRRRKRADGTYSAEESYHSSQDEDGERRRKKRREKREKAIRQGKRRDGSDSEYSYRSYVSDGGTRHVKRRRKKGDGTYSAEESYHSSQDEDGKERRRKRRAGRQKAFKKGKRREDSDSEYSYRSVVSAGGTRHVKRRRKRADGTYSDEESYHSSQDEDGEARRRRRRRDRKHAGSAHSYYSVVSAGGTRHVRRKKKRADGTYSDSESYHSSDSGIFEGKGKKKRRHHGSDSDYSYFSEVSAGGTKHRKRRQRIRDKDGKVIGHGKAEVYTSDSDDSSYEYVDDGKGGKVRVKKGKGKKDLKWKIGKDGKPTRGGGPDGNMTDFSDSLLSTDSEDEPDLSKMTEEEKKKYLEEKAKRRAEREKKRREKYGDKYEEMMEKHKKAKAAAKAAKSMVTYEKGSKRFGEDGWDDRSLGPGHDEWGKKKGKKKDGNEADSESEDGDDVTGRRRKKKGGHDSDEESIYEYMRDKDGNIIMGKDGKPLMKKIGTKKKGQRDDSDGDYDYKYDKFGNLMKVKKGEEVFNPEDSDGDPFEIMADGTIRLKTGKRKIDLSKLTDEQLKALGIDPRTMTKQEIARILKERFGVDIDILKEGQKVGLKHIDDYGSDANTDDLANDSDLDTSTLHGQRRVRVLMKKGGTRIQEHVKNLVDNSNIIDRETQHPDEKDASIDFLNHYRLVDPSKLDAYARAFAVEDDDYDSVLYPREARIALDGVPSVAEISKKQTQYILKVLDIDKETHLTFRMFAVMTALAERVTHMDSYCQELLEMSELIDIERKLALYKAMFYCNVPGDRDPNYIKAESLKIELMAGGLSWDQQEFVLEKLEPNDWREISFLDYLCYIPLFMSMHDGMIDNPLDVSNSKYTPQRPVSTQRDMNPLGYHLKKETPFIRKATKNRELKGKADDLLAGRRTSEIKQEGVDLYNKYQKLPHIKSSLNTAMMKGNKHF